MFQEDEPHAADSDMLKQAALVPAEMPQEQPQPGEHKLSPGLLKAQKIHREEIKYTN